MKITKEMIKKIIKQRKRGDSYGEIAKRNGVSRSSAYYWCLKHGGIK